MQTRDLLKQWLVDNSDFHSPTKELISGNLNLILTCKILFKDDFKR